MSKKDQRGGGGEDRATMIIPRGTRIEIDDEGQLSIHAPGNLVMQNSGTYGTLESVGGSIRIERHVEVEATTVRCRDSCYVQGRLTAWKVVATSLNLEGDARANVVLQETERMELGRGTRLVGNFGSEKELLGLFSRFARQVRDLPKRLELRGAEEEVPAALEAALVTDDEDVEPTERAEDESSSETEWIDDSGDDASKSSDSENRSDSAAGDRTEDRDPASEVDPPETKAAAPAQAHRGQGPSPLKRGEVDRLMQQVTEAALSGRSPVRRISKIPSADEELAELERDTASRTGSSVQRPRGGTIQARAEATIDAQTETQTETKTEIDTAIETEIENGTESKPASTVGGEGEKDASSLPDRSGTASEPSEASVAERPESTEKPNALGMILSEALLLLRYGMEAGSEKGIGRRALLGLVNLLESRDIETLQHTYKSLFSKVKERGPEIQRAEELIAEYFNRPLVSTPAE